MHESKPGDIEDIYNLIRGAEEDPNVPSFYFNGISIAGNERDVSIVLHRANEQKNVAVLYASHSVAKTLSHHLSIVIEKLESATKKEFGIIEYSPFE